MPAGRPNRSNVAQTKQLPVFAWLGGPLPKPALRTVRVPRGGGAKAPSETVANLTGSGVFRNTAGTNPWNAMVPVAKKLGVAPDAPFL